MQPTAAPPAERLQLGIDLGGTKIEGAVLDRAGSVRLRERIAAPRDDYAATVAAIAGLVRRLEHQAGRPVSIGIAMPGSIAPATGLVQNANSVWLNGRPFRTDLEHALGQQVRVRNDANCFILSEVVDGAAQGADVAFGVILGTGCGGGIAIGGRVLDGPRGIGGEWGHNPLPWPRADEHPGPRCWCGRNGCMETWVSGTGLAADHARVTGETTTGEAIAALADRGDDAARASLARHADRLARGLAHVVNLIDPDVIVLGGGLSQLAWLYAALPELMRPHVFADHAEISIRPPKWGDSSGVRGAAWLWPQSPNPS